MSSFQNHYLREVLGVQHYIPLQKILDQRTLKRKWPCDILIVVFKTLTKEESSFVSKIMKSISVSNFSILEIKQDHQAEEGIKNFLQKELARYVILFYDKIKLDHERSFTFSSLNQFLGASPEIQERKKHLWSELKKIKKGLKK